MHMQRLRISALSPGGPMLAIVRLIGPCFLILMLVGCSLPISKPPPASVQSPLIYPGVKQVTRQESKNPDGSPIKEASFSTSADPEDVRTFYTNTLLSDGWLPRRGAPADGLSFYWIEGCPVHGMEILVKSDPNNETEVEVTLTATTCR